MALQDLTPQLRTRLNRVEKAVGWFVLLAAALLLSGFVYYLYQTALRKGWFIDKIRYQTSLSNATGLNAWLLSSLVKLLSGCSSPNS